MCECLPGFRRVDKFNCAEINECQTDRHGCHANADCINTLGSYHCRCKKGYEGNGTVCTRKHLYLQYMYIEEESTIVNHILMFTELNINI